MHRRQRFLNLKNAVGRSQWPRALRSRSAAARLLGLWVRIPAETWKFFCCQFCVLSSRGLYDELITRLEESNQLWCVVVYDLETSWIRRHWPTGGLSRQKTNQQNFCGRGSPLQVSSRKYDCVCWIGQRTAIHSFSMNMLITVMVKVSFMMIMAKLSSIYVLLNAYTFRIYFFFAFVENTKRVKHEN